MVIVKFLLLTNTSPSMPPIVGTLHQDPQWHHETVDASQGTALPSSFPGWDLGIGFFKIYWLVLTLLPSGHFPLQNPSSAPPFPLHCDSMALPAPYTPICPSLAPGGQTCCVTSGAHPWLLCMLCWFRPSWLCSHCFFFSWHLFLFLPRPRSTSTSSAECWRRTLREGKSPWRKATQAK